MSILVEVSNQPFQYFTQMNLSKSIDEISGHCQLTVSEPKDDLSIIQQGDGVKVFLDGFPSSLFGYSEGVEDTEDDGSHNISFSVRDSVQDLIDSSVPQAVRIPTAYTDFSQIIEATLNGLGLGSIGVNNQRGLLPMPFLNGIPIVKAAEMGTGAGEYLTECARVVSVIMNNDGAGNLLLRNFSNLNKLKTMLLWQRDGKNNNILDGSLNIDWEERYGTIKVWSNGNTTYSQQNPLNGLGVYSGVAMDNEVRSTRYLEFFAQSPLPSNALYAMRAQEEVNLRRASSFKYVVKVQGFSANGQLWDIGQLVRVRDDKRRIYGWFLIKAIQYDYTLAGGSITTMTLTYPDAYGVSLSVDAANPLDPNSFEAAVTYTPVPASQAWKQGKSINDSITQTRR